MRRYETGFAFLAAAVPFLMSAASEVIGSVVGTATFFAIQGAMTPRSTAEQQSLIDRAVDASMTMASVGKWIGAGKAYENQLDAGFLTGERAWFANQMMDRYYARIGRIDQTDMEREAAFHALAFKFRELLDAEPGAKKSTTGTKTGSTTTPGSTTNTVPVPAITSGGDSAAGIGTTLLFVGGAAVVLGGLWWAWSSR